MARIRSIHPGIWTNEDFVSLEPLTRLFLIGLSNECDDQGVFDWKPRTLKMRLLPADNIDGATLLGELAALGAIRKFEVDGKFYGAVKNFRAHQRPEKPKAIYPMTPEIAAFVALASKGHPGSDRTMAPIAEPVDDEPIPDQSPTNPRPIPECSPTNPRALTEIDEQMEDGEVVVPQPLRGLAPKREKLATRLPDDWQPSPECVAFAEAEGIADVARTAAKFRDYWHGKGGQGGRKVSWTATWRNWCRDEISRAPSNLRVRAPPQTAFERRKAASDAAIASLMARGEVAPDDATSPPKFARIGR